MIAHESDDDTVATYQQLDDEIHSTFQQKAKLIITYVFLSQRKVQ